MSDQRVCLNGCYNRGEHFAACGSFGLESDGECPGCVPLWAREGALICDRCYRNVRRNLDKAPDLIALIRSQVDPLKATVYEADVIRGSRGPHSPAPIPVDLLDAGDALIQMLRRWWFYAEYGQAYEFEMPALEVGESSDDAYAMALSAAKAIDQNIDHILNDAAFAAAFVFDFAGFPPESDPDVWTVARALRRWTLEDRSYFATQPCPFEGCGLRSVKVFPPHREGGMTLFRCQKCGWHKSDTDDDGLWAEVFAPAVVAKGFTAEPGVAGGALVFEGTQLPVSWVQRAYERPEISDMSITRMPFEPALTLADVKAAKALQREHAAMGIPDGSRILVVDQSWFELTIKDVTYPVFEDEDGGVYFAYGHGPRSHVVKGVLAYAKDIAGTDSDDLPTLAVDDVKHYWAVAFCPETEPGDEWRFTYKDVKRTTLGAFPLAVVTA